MKMIGTHNSATGEKGADILSWFLTPFARCQSKTISEQLDAGCRLFDIRIRRKSNEWVVCHGLWTCEKSLFDILNILNTFSLYNEEKVYVRITYEGKLTMSDDDFLKSIDNIMEVFPHVHFFEVCEKKPKWRRLFYDRMTPTESHYLGLSLDRWQAYVPIPWLWKQFYFKNVEFVENSFREVDFL